jgi:hypothetical protein
MHNFNKNNKIIRIIYTFIHFFYFLMRNFFSKILYIFKFLIIYFFSTLLYFSIKIYFYPKPIQKVYQNRVLLMNNIIKVKLYSLLIFSIFQISLIKENHLQ